MGNQKKSLMLWNVGRRCVLMSRIREQMVRYFGHYGVAPRGINCEKNKTLDEDELIPSILKPDGSSKEYKKN